MPLRNLTPLTFKPKGLSDAIDGSNAFSGAMLTLENLVHAPTTESVFVPRSASTLVADFGSIFGAVGPISLQVTIGTRVYGLISTPRFPGYDEPFVYDLLARAFIPVVGTDATNVPATQATAGDWSPPTLSDVTNGRIVVTHPGFAGGISGKYIGWFDISGFTTTALKGNLTAGSPVIRSINDGGTSAPIADGVQVGMTVVGPGIPDLTTVVSLTNGSFSLNTTGDVNATTMVDNVASTVGVEVGMGVTGPLFVAGTYIVDIPASNQIVLSAAALGTATGTVVDIAGGGTITLSHNATATATSSPLTIAGGTPAVPAWGAGNTNGNPLLMPPTAVSQFSGRAYYAVNNALVWSDPLNPLQVTFASQAVLLGDSTPITALAGQPLVSAVTGGIVQSLFAFKGAQSYYQITGDADLNNLMVNVIAGSVGTQAPRTLCETPLGLAYIAPDGLRIINPQSGLCGPPIGAYGKGVSVPFINAVYPSRMCAAYGQNTIRISVQNVGKSGQPYEEYCFNIDQQSWSGPHTFPANTIGFYASASQPGFILAPQNSPGQLWFHSLVPLLTDTYSENGEDLSWKWRTSLFPDNGGMRMNKIVRTTIAMVLPPSQKVNVKVYDESGSVLDQLNVAQIIVDTTGIWDESNWDNCTWGPEQIPGAGAQWGTAVWGKFIWGAISGYLAQRRIPWHLPIVFKQGSLSCTGASQAGFAIGNLYVGYQIRGYMLEDGL